MWLLRRLQKFPVNPVRWPQMTNCRRKYSWKSSFNTPIAYSSSPRSSPCSGRGWGPGRIPTISGSSSLLDLDSTAVTKPFDDSFFHSDYPPFLCFSTVSGVNSGKGWRITSVKQKMGLKRVPKIGILISILDPVPSQDKGSMGRR